MSCGGNRNQCLAQQWKELMVAEMFYLFQNLLLNYLVCVYYIYIWHNLSNSYTDIRNTVMRKSHQWLSDGD